MHLPESDLLNVEKSPSFSSSFAGIQISTVIVSSAVSIGIVNCKINIY